jgi:peptidoglycan/LPS O-acetylase OafA/YrhL
VLVPDEAVDLLAPAAAAAPPARAKPVDPATLAAGQGEFLAGDGVRGVGMICIIVAHLAGGALVIDGVFDAGFRAGYGTFAGIVLSGLQLALPVFFVLSAYLISRPYVRAYILGRRTPSLRRYLTHRVLRIIPVFWLLTTLMLIVYGPQHSSFKDWLAVFDFTQIYHTSGASAFIGQAWTIDVEVAFYLIVPLSAWVFTRATRRLAVARGGRDLSVRSRVVLITGLLAVAAVVSAALRAATIGTLWTESPPATFYYFAPGVALAAIEFEFAAPLARGRFPHLPLILGLGSLLIAAGLALAASLDTNALLRTRGALGVALATGMAFTALLARQRARGDSNSWIDNRVTRWLGVRSYPCYIIQSATVFEVVRLVGRVGGPWTELLVLTGLGLPLTLAAGAVVHALVERPVLAWGRGRTFRAVVPRQA